LPPERSPIIPTNYKPTNDHRSAPGIIQNGQPPREWTLSGGSTIQVKHLNILDPSAASKCGNLVQSHRDGAIFDGAGQAKRAIYKFAVPAPASAKACGKNPARQEAIRHLIRGGCELRHFGRPSLPHKGLRRFNFSGVQKSK
jgi:hypothetical protein